jgi:hypothetical protein
VDELPAPLFRRLHDLVILQALRDLRVGFGQHLLGLVLGSGEDLLLLLHDAACLAYLGGHGNPHLVDKVQQAAAVHDHVAAEGQTARLPHHLFQAVDEVLNVDGRPP